MNEEIRNVMHSYFHQDWMQEFSSIEEVARSIVDQNSNEFVLALIDRLDRMLEENQTDSDIALALDTVSAEYVPENARAWVAELVHLLKSLGK